MVLRELQHQVQDRAGIAPGDPGDAEVEPVGLGLPGVEACGVEAVGGVVWVGV